LDIRSVPAKQREEVKVGMEFDRGT